MPLNEVEKSWITAVTAVETSAAAFVEKQARKDKKLDEMHLKLAAFKASIGQGQDYQVEKDGATLKSKSKGELGGVLDSGSSKAMNEIDVTELAGSKALTPQQVKIIHEAQAKVVHLAEELLAEKPPVVDEKEFNQLATREIWTPLVREGVIPENAVPDRFSEFKQMFDAANQMYTERLKEFTKKQEENAEKLQKLGQSKEFAGKVLDLAKAITTTVPGDEAKLAAQVLGTMKMVSDGGFDLATAAIKVKGDDIVKAVVGIVGSVLGAAAPGIGELVATGVKSLVSGGMIGHALAKDPPDVEAALGHLGDALSSAFSAVDKGTGGDGLLTRIGGHIGAAVTTSNHANAIRKAIAGGSPQEIILAFSAAVQTALTEVKSVQTEVAAAQEKSRLEAERDKKLAGAKTPKEREDIGETYKKKIEALDEEDDEDEDEDEGGDDEEGDKGGAAMKGEGAWKFLLSGKADPKTLEKVKKMLDDEKIKHELDSIDQDSKVFEQLLVMGFKQPVNDAQKAHNEAAAQMASIEQLIAQLQRDRMILDTLEKLAGSAAAVIDAFVVGIGVGAAVEFSVNAIKAVNRAKELNEWVDNLQDSQRSGTVYDEAFMNRVRSSRVQLSQDVEKAAIALAKFVGDTATMSGIGAGAGAIIKGAASAAGVAADIAFKAYSMAEAERGWNLYQAALKEPANRKKARESLIANATLSKYSIVYGAVVAKDPVAVNAMGKLGLTEKVLANPGTNAAKCAQFLEMRFRDDLTVLRAVPIKKDWYKGEVALTMKSWASIKVAGQRSAEPKLKPDSSGALDAAILAVEKAEAAVAAKAKDRDPIELYEALLQALARAGKHLEAYRPVGADGKPHADVLAFAANLAAQATKRSAEVDGLLKDLRGRVQEAVDELDEQAKKLTIAKAAPDRAAGVKVAEAARQVMERREKDAELMRVPAVAAARTALADLLPALGRARADARAGR